MSYSEFSLARAKKEFGLTTLEKRDIFANLPELTASNLLTETMCRLKKKDRRVYR